MSNGFPFTARALIRHFWAKTLAPRLLNRWTVGGIIGKLSFDPGEFWFREFIDGDAAEEPLEPAVLMRAA